MLGDVLCATHSVLTSDSLLSKCAYLNLKGLRALLGDDRGRISLFLSRWKPAVAQSVQRRAMGRTTERLEFEFL
jgi:hypothetical protein